VKKDKGDTRKQITPTTVGVGKAFEARYREIDSPLFPQWSTNPLIQALPPILSEHEFSELVTELPKFDPEIRNLPRHERIAAIDQLTRVNVILQQHILLKQRFDRILRDSYIFRNPIDDLSFIKVHQKVQKAIDLTGYALDVIPEDTSPGFAIIGIGGVGKTRGVGIVLKTYPQILIHREYQDGLGKTHHLLRTQVVYLKITCPIDGTLKSLCNLFFIAVDQQLGEDYQNKYGLKEDGTVQRNAMQMIPSMARVAAFISLGVLVIDEIQNLSKQKSGGQQIMLQFFSFLMDEIKVPVILIGTPKAEELLNGQFWQMRRNAGQGQMYWGRLERTGVERSLECEWERFLSSIWNYQYTKNPIRRQDGLVPKEFSDVLYDESQGIIDFAIKLFRLSQERAINRDQVEELLTIELIQQVANDLFGSMRTIVQALKTGDTNVLAQIDDVKLAIDQRAKQMTQAVSEPQTSSVQQSPIQPNKKTAKAPKLTLPMPLVEVFRAAQQSKSDPVEALRKAGFVGSLQDFGDADVDMDTQSPT
jgi:hypothetical protein